MKINNGQLALVVFLGFFIGGAIGQINDFSYHPMIMAAACGSLLILSLVIGNPHKPVNDDEKLMKIGQLKLEGDELRARLACRDHALDRIQMVMCNIRGPLNGNVDGFTKFQLRYFFEIQSLSEEREPEPGHVYDTEKY